MILAAYKPIWGDTIAQWITCEAEAYWLAPGTPPPITAEKVATWKKSGGSCLVGFLRDSVHPVAYGELNPMRADGNRYWIGHILVDSALRGQGIGQRFVRRLLENAFNNLQARNVSLVVFPDNLGAIRCYQKCGFRLAGEERHRFRPEGELHRLLRFEAGPNSIKPKSLLSDRNFALHRFQELPNSQAGSFEACALGNP